MLNKMPWNPASVAGIARWRRLVFLWAMLNEMACNSAAAAHIAWWRCLPFWWSIERTCDVIQHYIKFYGRVSLLWLHFYVHITIPHGLGWRVFLFYFQTARLTSPEGRQRDYFEVEFFFQEEARDALKNCKIPHMTIEWAEGNISDNRLTGNDKLISKSRGWLLVSGELIRFCQYRTSKSFLWPTKVWLWWFQHFGKQLHHSFLI